MGLTCCGFELLLYIILLGSDSVGFEFCCVELLWLLFLWGSVYVGLDYCYADCLWGRIIAVCLCGLIFCGLIS